MVKHIPWVLDTLAHIYNTNNQDAEGKDSSKYKASLGYRIRACILKSTIIELLILITEFLKITFIYLDFLCGDTYMSLHTRGGQRTTCWRMLPFSTSWIPTGNRLSHCLASSGSWHFFCSKATICPIWFPFSTENICPSFHLLKLESLAIREMHAKTT